MKEIDKMIEEKVKAFANDNFWMEDCGQIDGILDFIKQAMREAYEAGYENGKQDALIAIKQIHKILQDFKEETNEKE